MAHCFLPVAQLRVWVVAIWCGLEAVWNVSQHFEGPIVEVAACTSKGLISSRHSNKFVLNATLVTPCWGYMTSSVRVIVPFTCLGPKLELHLEALDLKVVVTHVILSLMICANVVLNTSSFVGHLCPATAANAVSKGTKPQIPSSSLCITWSCYCR